MFDIGWPELMIVMIVALLVIGPKDLPKALRQLGRWVGAARRMSTEFRRHVDDIVREAELDDVKRGIDSVRSVNIKRELERQIDPDGSLSRAFDVSSPKSPGKTKDKPALANGGAPVKSWQSAEVEPPAAEASADGAVGASTESGTDTGRAAETQNDTEPSTKSTSARGRITEPAETSGPAATATSPSDQV